MPTQFVTWKVFTLGVSVAFLLSCAFIFSPLSIEPLPLKPEAQSSGQISIRNAISNQTVPEFNYLFSFVGDETLTLGEPIQMDITITPLPVWTSSQGLGVVLERVYDSFHGQNFSLKWTGSAWEGGALYRFNSSGSAPQLIAFFGHYSDTMKYYGYDYTISGNISFPSSAIPRSSWAWLITLAFLIATVFVIVIFQNRVKIRTIHRKRESKQAKDEG